MLRLQGTMAPDQLISLENLGGPSFAMADHDDHVHIGCQPPFAGAGPEARFVQLLGPKQWLRLTDRLEEINNPDVSHGPVAPRAARRARRARKRPPATAAPAQAATERP